MSAIDIRRTTIRTTRTHVEVRLTATDILTMLQHAIMDVPNDAEVVFDAYDRGEHDIDSNRPVIVRWVTETTS